MTGLQIIRGQMDRANRNKEQGSSAREYAAEPAEPALRRKPYQLAEIGIMLLILGITFAVYVASPVITSTDSAYTFHIAASILRDGDIRLDEYSHLIDLANDYRVMLRNGHIYSYYPSATPLLAVPVTWAVNQLFPLRHDSDFYTYLLTHKPDGRTVKLELWTAAFISAIFAAVIYQIGRAEGLSKYQALLLTSIAAFASPMYSTSSRALWQHGPSALALALTVFFILRFASSPGQTKYIYAAALFLGLSYLIRPTNSLSVIFLTLYVLANYRSKLPAFLAIMAGIMALFMLHSYTTYGTLQPPYSFQLFSRVGSPASFLNAFAGLVVSPNRGLLVFSPIFIFSLYGIHLLIKGRSFTPRNIEPYLLCIFVLHWLLTASFEQWDGGWTLGPRYMADLTAYLCIFLIPVIRSIASTKRWDIRRSLFAACIAASIAIQTYISISPHPFYWTGKPEALTEAPGRVWDWTDLQILRGTCREDPREGKAPACWFNPPLSRTDPQ